MNKEKQTPDLNKNHKKIDSEIVPKISLDRDLTPKEREAFVRYVNDFAFNTPEILAMYKRLADK